MLIFAADLPPSAASIHHQQWQTPQSRWICPWQRSLQRAADIHMVRPRTFHSISLSSCVFTNILSWVYTTTTAPCWGSIWCACWIWHWSRSLIVCALFRMDATLKELTSLVKEVYPEARKKGTHFSFAIVYPDPRGKVYRLVSHNNSTGWMHAAGHLLTGLVNLCGLNTETCVSPPLSGWKISATPCPAGRAQMTPWHCSLSASRLETTWT